MDEGMREDSTATLAEGPGATLREYGGVYLKGLAMGTADAVPGMSGGTIALITGIYERLITAVTALDPRILRSVTDVRSAAGRRRFVADLVDRDVQFLIALGLGMVTGLVTVSRVAEAALHGAPVATYAFFFGLIAAATLVLGREVDASTPGRVAAGVGGFALAVGVSIASGGGALPNSLPVVTAAGAIAVSAMVLPGISGSSFLLLLGQYEYLIGQLSAFVDRSLALATGGGLDRLIEPGTTVAAFLVGAVVGLFTVAHVVQRALAAYREATLATLVGLLAGTLAIPVLEVDAAAPGLDAGTVAAVLIPAVVGAVAVLALDAYTDELTY